MDTPESVIEMLLRIEDAYAPQPPAPLGEAFEPIIQ
jgi:hypothetical protein